MLGLLGKTNKQTVYNRLPTNLTGSAFNHRCMRQIIALGIIYKSFYNHLFLLCFVLQVYTKRFSNPPSASASVGWLVGRWGVGGVAC